MDTAEYDPFASGRFPVGVRTIDAPDPARGRVFPCEIWYPAHTGVADQPAGTDEARDAPPRRGAHPLVVFSHYSGGHRRSATFLCTHLASRGYVVAALDHSEVVARELGSRDGETETERAMRIDAVVASRVPDVRFLLDYLLGPVAAAEPAHPAGGGQPAGIGLDAARVGLVGHSFGGWTALAAPEAEPRVRAVVAMGPGGSAHLRPGPPHSRDGRPQYGRDGWPPHSCHGRPPHSRHGGPPHSVTVGRRTRDPAGLAAPRLLRAWPLRGLPDLDRQLVDLRRGVPGLVVHPEHRLLRRPRRQAERLP